MQLNDLVTLLFQHPCRKKDVADGVDTSIERLVAFIQTETKINSRYLGASTLTDGVKLHG